MLHPLEIVPLYAALLAVLFVVAALNVIRLRVNRKVLFGTGGDAVFAGRVRAHANFAEYVPLALLLLMIAELQGARSDRLQGLCIVLVVARIAHVWGLSNPGAHLAFRAGGTILTVLVILGAAGLLVFS